QAGVDQMPPPHTPSPSPAGARIAWGLVAILATIAAVLGAVLIRNPPPGVSDRASLQFTIFPPADTRLGGPIGGGSGSAAQLSISPDGRTLAFIALRQNDFVVFLRPLGSLSAHALPGTEGASFPFWSPDSRFVAFFSGGKPKKVPINGGPPLVICDAFDGRSGAWNEANVIIFGSLRTTGIMRVSASGGTPVAVTTHDEAYGELNHRFP